MIEHIKFGLPIVQKAFEFLSKFLEARNRAKLEAPKQGFINRLLRLFDCQRINRPQIIRVLGDKIALSPADVFDDAKFLEKLDDRAIGHIAELFGVSRSWLEGECTGIYPCVYAHKNLEGFIQLVGELRRRHDDVELCVVKGKDNLLDREPTRRPILVALRGSVGSYEDLMVWRDYPLSEPWPWSEPLCRIEVKALCLIAWQFSVHPNCYDAKQTDIDRFFSGKLLLGELLELTCGERWHLDDYIFTSDESVKAVDEEEALVVRQHLEHLNIMRPLLEAAGLRSLKTPTYRKRKSESSERASYESD